MSNVFSDQIFNPGFVLEGPHLVEASAGTGKTYNIQNIYARLVVEKGLRVDQIQVMTFTEAATKELRDRVRRVLAGFADLYAGNVADMKPEELERFEKLRACARANLAGDDAAADKTARERLELALMEFDKSAISTIHGFCSRALKRFAFETSSAFGTELEDDKAAAIALKVRDWWRNEHDDVDESVRDQLALDGLGGYAAVLSRKSDWTIDESPEPDAETWMLTKARTFVDEYETERPVRDTQTYDDLLRGLRDALHDAVQGKVLARLLRGEFRAALIDEFQDTDPVQYDIFREIFLAPEALADSMLFLVGDVDQLASVERGRVFGDLCRMQGVSLSRLEESARFRPNEDIARLANAVNAGRADDALALLKSDSPLVKYVDLASVQPFEPSEWPGFEALLGEKFAALRGCKTAAEALEHVNDVRILCAVRKGPYGVERMNDFVNDLLGRRCPVPMMITQNDRTLGVANGDVGVIMPGEASVLYVPGRDAPRSIRVELLPNMEKAFASTVHKSQGSEFRDVVMVLPPNGENPLLTREILYTGITRTKGKVYLHGGDESVKLCCERKVERVSGLS